MATPTQSEFEKMSKQQLKSWLTAQRVDLPGEDRPKSFFLTLALSKSQTRPHRPRRSRKRSRSAVEAGEDDGNPRPQPSRRAAKRTRTIPTVSSQVPEENTSKSPVPRRRLKRRRSSSRSKKKSRSRSRSKSKKARTTKHTRTTIRVNSPVKPTTSASYRSPQFNKLCESSPENEAMAVDRTSEDDTDDDVEMTAEPQKSSREQNIPLECSTETNNAQPASPEHLSSAPSLNYSSTRQHSTTSNPSRVVSSPRMTLSNRRQSLDSSPRRKTSSQPIIPPPMRSPVQLSSAHTPAVGALIQPAPLFTGGSSHGILSPGSAFAGNLIPIDLSSSFIGRPNLRMPAQFGAMGRVSPRISRQKRWHEFIVICLRIALVGMCGMLALYGLFILVQDFVLKSDPIYCNSSHKLKSRSYTEQDCIPCPKNAICAGGNVFCKGDRSWDKERQLCDFGNVEALISQISIASEKFCGARYGEFLCGTSSESRLVKQTELQEHIASVLGMHRTSELFNYVFKKYYKIISEDRGRTQPISYHLGSDSFESRVAIRPFWCRTRHFLWKFKFWVFVVCPTFVWICFRLFHWYTFNVVLPSQAAHLERDAVRILRNRASEHHQPEFFPASRVRSGLGSRAKDDHVWKLTKKLIDKNRNVQVSQRTFEGVNCMCWKFLPV